MAYRRASIVTAMLMVLFACAGSAGAAGNRYALLIGNQAYDPSVGVLRNPHNDVAIVGEALRKQGFEVLPLVENADRTAILGAVRELAHDLRAAGSGAIGFLYYSGHGVAEQDTNVNYLIPVDVKDPGSAAFWDKSLKLDEVLQLLDLAPHAVKFVVFDACRSELQMPTKDVTKGLLPIAEQKGFFIAYSTAPGRAALDRGEGSGPYAAALATELSHPGLDQLNLFQNVKESVIASTGGEQQPWENNGLTRRVYLTGEPTTPADMALWESVRTTNDPQALQTYLERFPTGVFASTAAQMIDRLNAEVAQRAAAAKFEIERKAQQAKQTEQLQQAVDEARKAREELSLAQEKQAKADSDAEQARAAVAAALADREAIAAREQQLLKEQKDLNAKQSEASKQSAAEIAAAKAELETKLKAVTGDLQTARESLTAAQVKQQALEKAAQEASAASDAKSRAPAVAAADAQVAVLTPVPKAPDATFEPQDGEAGETALKLTDQERLAIKTALLKQHSDPGRIDSNFDSDARAAIRSWQYAENLPVTGFLNGSELMKLIGPRGQTRASQNKIAVSYTEAPAGADPRLERAIPALVGFPITFATIDKHLFIAVAARPRGGIMFDDARKLAERAGGTIATVESAFQNKAIFDLIAEDPRFWGYDSDGFCSGPWLGLFQVPGSRSSKVGWQWVDGSVPRFSNWFRTGGGGQPNEIDLGNGPGAAAFGGKCNHHPTATWQDGALLKEMLPGFIIEIR